MNWHILAGKPKLNIKHLSRSWQEKILSENFFVK